MNKRLVFVLFTLLLINFGCNQKREEKNITDSPKIKKMERSDYYANQATNIFIQKMKDENGLIAIGTGGGGISEKGLKTLSVTFECYERVEIDKARELLVQCTNRFLEEINKNRRLKEYLETIPFTSENVDVGILFINEKIRGFAPAPFLAIAEIAKNELRYVIDENDFLKTIKRESYEEALQILDPKKI